ncbi:DUF2642 domain-containing protein [Sporosarcina sp. FSL K6-1522]|uniref:DUF2642 domain-containing protein n=1 Tax=Sporosarcina sp. FSL K6-1522 TaxID=2921554 RepID=UPI00315A79B4
MQEQNFKKAVGDLKDMKIGLVLGDNQLIEGILLDVKEDHIVVHVNQNVFYFALQHIQALSRNAKDFCISSEIVPYLNKNYLVDVLRAFRYTWVTINSLSNLEITGVLSRISEDHVMIINNAEQLYIPKSYIANIYSTISEEDIIFINNQEQSATQNSTISKGLLEINEQHATSGEEEAIQESDTNLDDEAKEQSDSSLEEKLLAVLQAEQGADNHIKTTNNSEVEENSKAPMIETFTGEILEDEKNEYVKTGHKKSIQDFISLINEKSKEWLDVSLEEDLQEICRDEKVDYEGVLESAKSTSSEEQLTSTESQPRHNEKRILLTEWSTIKDEQLAMMDQNNSNEESDPPIHGGESMEMENDEDFCILDEKSELIESTSTNPITKKNSLKEEKAMLEKQYYALMKHAEESSIRMEHRSEYNQSYLETNIEFEEKNNVHILEGEISSQEERTMLEKQYAALMKHAEKMYQQLRD